jgi:16S rRNA (adenine1518-N6/adenine1519-N6)-dimethyltransferase
MDVPAWEDPRRVLARHGLAPKRGFSQNFLVSRSVVEQIVAALAPQPVALAGNLPYAITGSIFRGLGAQYACVDRAVLMVQREVRDRLLGEPGSKQYGALSVFTRAVFEVRPVCLVPAGAFHPPPRVESAVIKLTPRAQPIDAGAPEFQRCVRAAFDARRKTLRNALLQAYPGERVDGALVRAGIDGKRRGETLTVEEFARLASELDAAAASPNGRESAP